MCEDEFARLVAEAFAELPAEFRAACDGLVVRSPALASDETLDAMEIDDPYELLGLYHGIGLAHKSTSDPAQQPDVVLIYRLAVLAYARDHELDVRDVVRHVLVHEIGHHLGFSDEDMERIEGG